MKIFYGALETKLDVTSICYNKLMINNNIIIPEGDCNRANLFSDPIQGILKTILITMDDGYTQEYDYTLTIHIDTTTNIINAFNVDTKLTNMWNNLRINHGDFYGEIPEQKMTVRYLTGNEKVLEIGSNIGRNSLIISDILEKKSNYNFVTLETDTDIANQLCENKKLNNKFFHIENSALSKNKLIQIGWDTIESDILYDGYKSVNTITWDDLNSKYNIQFDTLILDCEGAFYNILRDMPEILLNIKLIIMENDYHDITKKNYVDDILQKNNFKIDYSEAGGWGPCFNNFFEVWKKI